MASTGSAQLTHLTLGVAYLSCNGCAGKVSSALKEIKGVQSVAVDYRSGVADVEFDASSVGSVELISAVEKVGYHAQVGPYSETELTEFAKTPAAAPTKVETSKSCSGGN
jgi:copper chaperone CopZ